MTAKFTELTKVQMPAIMHLTRLEYTYAGKFHDNQAGEDYDPDTNILIKIVSTHLITPRKFQVL